MTPMSLAYPLIPAAVHNAMLLAMAAIYEEERHRTLCPIRFTEPCRQCGMLGNMAQDAVSRVYRAIGETMQVKPTEAIFVGGLPEPPKGDSA